MHTTIIGLGCFGRALADLVSQHGGRVRVFDVSTDVQTEPYETASTLEEAVLGTDIVVIAVPVPVFSEVLSQLKPHLRPEQLVMDVGSVKSGPCNAMASMLGTAIPWVGTHPLFGPNSIAMGEWPLRVVVCPNELHPESVERAADFKRPMNMEDKLDISVEVGQLSERSVTFDYTVLGAGGDIRATVQIKHAFVRLSTFAPCGPPEILTNGLRKLELIP
ncbi:MAG TPA: prephenate dehydrogenase/arogenate dehydrogenase family protein [Myxococcales bacterium]|nr:prephenate dehydrogenase/arogenate dehydrogenase family protein [Myxococcales bacterium]